MLQKLASLFALCIFFNFTSNGQPINVGTRPMPSGRRVPTIGRLYGKIVDKQTKKVVDYASVTVLSMQKDSVIGGVLVAANGDFSIEKLPLGKYRLRVQFIGYKSYTQQVTITPNTIEQDLGDIQIEPDVKRLEGVVIEGEKASVNMNIDRRTYNVDRDISSRGGTAIDVMKNIPGLTVDADGNVALRNNAPIIFIDGRPTTLTLEQLPAEQIERIEVITNSSAKYDASATGGIVNVVMKTNNKPGYNGMIGASIGTNKRYGLNGNLNVKEKKVNFFISYNLNARENPAQGFTNRTTFNNEVTTGVYNQNNENLASNLMQFGRFGFDFYLNNRNTLTVAQNLMQGNWNQYDDQQFTQMDGNNIVVNTGNRLNDQKNQFRNYTAQLMWKRTFPKQGKEWTADLGYNIGRFNSDALFTTSSYDAVGLLLPHNPNIQLNIGSGKNEMVNFQYDYANPLTDSSKFEWGIKSNYKLNRTGLNVDVLDNAANNFLRDTFLTNDYRITDIVTGAYANYIGYLGGIGYQAGLRFEQTNFTGELVNKNLTFAYIYPNGTQNLAKAIFPSVYFSKKIGERKEYQLNFSRKIERPGRMQIMPFILFSDKLNYQIGNPSLAPEFINLAEANHNRIWDWGNWLSSAYFRYQQDPITQYVYRSLTDSNVLITTYINGQANAGYGWENTFKTSLFKRKLDFTINANIFYVNINANTASGALQNEGFSWNAKAIINYKLPANFTAQVNGSYEAPRIIPQGKTITVYSIDFSLNKEVSKKLSFNFTINDIFNTRRFGSQFSTDFFMQDLSRRRDVRFFRIGFTYRFGEWDTSLFKKRKAGGRESQGGGMDMDY